MAWARFDDRFHEHRKVRRVWRRQPAALGLHLMAVTYSCGHLTDGHVDPEFVEDQVHDPEQREAMVGALVDAGLWEPTDDGWRIHDFTDFNPTRREVEARRNAKIKAGKRGAKARWNKGSVADAMADAKAGAMADGDALAFPGNAPDPTRPVPLPSTTSKQENSNVELKLDRSVRSSVADVREIFEYWQRACNHPSSKLSPDRRRKIETRLREGYSVEQIKAAVDGAAVGAFVGDNGKRFDDIELICRNGSKLESFIGRHASADKPNKGAASQMLADMGYGVQRRPAA